MDENKTNDFNSALSRMKEIEKEVADESLDLEDCIKRLDEGVDLAKGCMQSVRENLERESVLSDESENSTSAE